MFNFFSNRCVVLLVLLLTLLPASTHAQSTTPDSTPQLGFHINDGTAAHMQAVREAGGGFVIAVMSWEDIEPTPNYLYWEKPDALLRAAEFYGVGVVARLDRPPAWALDDGSPSPWSLDAYANFVRRVATRYGGRLDGVIIWNEPNLALEWNGEVPDAEAYVALLKAGYEASKAVAPDVPVLGGGLAFTEGDGVNGVNDLVYFDSMLQAGAADYFDVLALHPYGFGRSPSEPPALDRLNFRRLEFHQRLMRDYGAAGQDGGDKPIWITEMGWRTSAPDPADRWQVVTPRQQVGYSLAALGLLAADYPQIQRATFWEFTDTPDQYGYALWLGPSQTTLTFDELATLHPQPLPASQSEIPNPQFPIPILAPDAPIRLGDIGWLHPHWVHLYEGGENFSPLWTGEFFLDDAQVGPSYELLIETMQIDQPTNRVQINGVDVARLEARPRLDPTSTWVMQRLAVPGDVLRAGVNTLTVRSGQRNPTRQYDWWRWENLQFRNARLVPAQALGEPLLTSWQAQPSPSGWAEFNRLRGGLTNDDGSVDLWLTGNRPGQLFRARQAVDGTPSALVNEAGSLANVVFVDILATESGQLAATDDGLFWRTDGDVPWQRAAGLPDRYAYVVTEIDGRFYTGFEEFGLWKADAIGGPWRYSALAPRTVTDVVAVSTGEVSASLSVGQSSTSSGVRPLPLAVGSSSTSRVKPPLLRGEGVWGRALAQPAPTLDIFAATSNGLHRKSIDPQRPTFWSQLPALPDIGLDGLYGPVPNPFMTRLYPADGTVVVRNVDQLWRWSEDAWQPVGPEPRYGKLNTLLDCCGGDALIGTNLLGLYQKQGDGWREVSHDLFTNLEPTTSARISDTIYIGTTNGVYYTQLGDGEQLANDQPWQKLDGLPATVSDLLIDPANPQQRIAATPAGIYRSGDGGATWQPSSEPWVVWDLALGGNGRVYAANADGTAWSANAFAADARWNEPSDLDNLLYFSVNPSPFDPSVMWAGTWGNDIAVSNDGGATFELLHNGLETLSVLDVLWHPTPGQLTIATIEGLFRSDDGGASWFKLPGLLDQQTVHSLLQGDDGVLWAGAADGLWHSDDFGATWSLVEGMPRATILRLGTLDAQQNMQQSRWLWAGSEGNGLWLSQDGGASWQFGGLPEHSVFQVLADPLDAGRVIVATERGIYHASLP